MALNGSQSTVIIASTILPTLAILALLLRVRARSITSKSLKADDYWLVAATVGRSWRTLLLQVLTLTRSSQCLVVFPTSLVSPPRLISDKALAL